MRMSVFTLLGCGARADPIEADVRVTEAGTASPVAAGTDCVLRMQSAWHKRGVNCQVRARVGGG